MAHSSLISGQVAMIRKYIATTVKDATNEEEMFYTECAIQLLLEAINDYDLAKRPYASEQVEIYDINRAESYATEMWRREFFGVADFIVNNYRVDVRPVIRGGLKAVHIPQRLVDIFSSDYYVAVRLEFENGNVDGEIVGYINKENIKQYGQLDSLHNYVIPLEYFEVGDFADFCEQLAQSRAEIARPVIAEDATEHIEDIASIFLKDIALLPETTYVHLFQCQYCNDQRLEERSRRQRLIRKRRSLAMQNAALDALLGLSSLAAGIVQAQQIRMLEEIIKFSVYLASRSVSVRGFFGAAEQQVFMVSLSLGDPNRIAQRPIHISRPIISEGQFQLSVLGIPEDFIGRRFEVFLLDKKEKEDEKEEDTVAKLKSFIDEVIESTEDISYQEKLKKLRDYAHEKDIDNLLQTLIDETDQQLRQQIIHLISQVAPRLDIAPDKGIIAQDGWINIKEDVSEQAEIWPSDRFLIVIA